MDIFDYAMQMEKDGERYYREMADRISHEGLRNILYRLAEDEVKHHQVLQRMKIRVPMMEGSRILTYAKNIFVLMKEQKSELHFDHLELALYEKAREIERESQRFYEEKAMEVSSAAQKELFLKIAKEEEKHCLLLDNIVELVLRPQNWVENGEFYHLEEY